MAPSHLKADKILQEMQVFYKLNFNKMVATHANRFSLLHLNVSSLPYQIEESN